MTATQSPPEPAPDRVRLAGCPLGGTPDVGLTAQDATTALGVPTRRRASSGGIPGSHQHVARRANCANLRARGRESTCAEGRREGSVQVDRPALPEIYAAHRL